MTETEKKALALVNEAREVMPLMPNEPQGIYGSCWEALCRAIEQHDAYKQEVSDALEQYFGGSKFVRSELLNRFIIPKPDPLVEAVKDCQFASLDAIEDYVAKKLRAAIEARGGRIVWEGE